MTVTRLDDYRDKLVFKKKEVKKTNEVVSLHEYVQLDWDRAKDNHGFHAPSDAQTLLLGFRTNNIHYVVKLLEQWAQYQPECTLTESTGEYIFESSYGDENPELRNVFTRMLADFLPKIQSYCRVHKIGIIIDSGIELDLKSSDYKTKIRVFK